MPRHQPVGLGGNNVQPIASQISIAPKHQEMVMNTPEDPIDQRRRHLIGAAAIAAAAAQFGTMVPATAQEKAQDKAQDRTVPGKPVSFDSLKHVDAGLLNVAYVEAGPTDGRPVILLHGWPYDIHAFVDATPMLASAGFRVLIPSLRGYGATRFLSADSFRNGQPAALAMDLIAFMDALKIDKAILAGFDWGGRTGDIVAALWPERVRSLVSVSGYLIGSQRPARCRCRRRPSSSGGTSSISPPSAAGSATRRTGTTSTS
jgi:hypothetical protein